MAIHLQNHDITSTTDHNFPGGATVYLDGTGSFSTPGGSGDVTGPAGGVADNEIALFSGTTGKIIKGSSGAVLADYILATEKGANNGVATLDGSGLLPASQLPVTAMEYLGAWNASTNSPTLSNGSGTNGDFYLCSTAGTVDFGAGNITFAVGDSVIYNGSIWEKVGRADAVSSVFGRTGVVAAAASDYDASQVDNDSSVTGAFVDDALNNLLADTVSVLASDPGSPATGQTWILDSGSGNRLFKYYDGSAKWAVEMSQE